MGENGERRICKQYHTVQRGRRWEIKWETRNWTSGGVAKDEKMREGLQGNRKRKRM